MALSAGSSAIWSDINAIYNTLRSIQSAHGLSQTGNSGGQGSTIARTNIVTLYNAASSTHGEKHLTGAAWTNVTVPAVGTVIQPGFITTIRTNVNNMNGICHFDFGDCFSSCFDFGDSCYSGAYN